MYVAPFRRSRLSWRFWGTNFSTGCPFSSLIYYLKLICVQESHCHLIFASVPHLENYLLDYEDKSLFFFFFLWSVYLECA